MAAKLIQEFDKNGDQALSVEELTASLQAQRDRRSGANRGGAAGRPGGKGGAAGGPGGKGAGGRAGAGKGGPAGEAGPGRGGPGGKAGGGKGRRGEQEPTEVGQGVVPKKPGE